MADPFRPPLWRRGRVAVVAAFLATAPFFGALQYWWSARSEALLAQTPEIISATYLGVGVMAERRLRPREMEAVFVQLEDGSQRMFTVKQPDRRLERCTMGGPITLEQRGLALSLARSPCSTAPESKVKAAQE